MALLPAPTQTPAERAEQLFDQVSRRPVVMGRLLPGLTEGNVRHFATNLIPGSLGADWLTPERFDLVSKALTVDWKSALVLLDALARGGVDLTRIHPEKGTLLHEIFFDEVPFPEAMTDPVCDFLLEHIDPFEPDEDGDTAHEMWQSSERQAEAMGRLADPRQALLEAVRLDEPEAIAKALDGHASFRRILGQTHNLLIEGVPLAVHAAMALCCPESLQVLKDAGVSFSIIPDDTLPPLLVAMEEAATHWHLLSDTTPLANFYLPECSGNVPPRLVRDARKNAFATLDFILGQGVDIRLQSDVDQDDSDETVKASMLSMALGVGALDLVRFCLERGANPYEETDNGDGLVMSFFYAGGQHCPAGKQITELLMEYGVDPYRQDTAGDSIAGVLGQDPEEEETLRDILEGQRNKLAEAIPEATRQSRGPGKRI